MAAKDLLTQGTMSTRTDTLKQNDSRGFRSFIRGLADLPALRTDAGQAVFASWALMVAAAEFAVCLPALLILAGLDLVPVVDAVVWGVVTLVPLSMSISFLALVNARLGQAAGARKARLRFESAGSPKETYA
jgi:hypothetical protein